MQIHSEEVLERHRHNRKYTQQTPESLRIEPRHWQKFDGIFKHIHCYTYAVVSLGDIAGKEVLDLGCGTGWFSVILAKKGAMVTGVDISPEAIAIARKRAIVNAVSDRVNFMPMSFYDLKSNFRAESFDKTIGLSVLHHCQHKSLLADQLCSILKPGGRVVFNEPFGNVRWLERIRLLLPIAVNEQDKTHWQEQLTYADLDELKPHFEVGFKEFQFISRLDRVIRDTRLITWFGHLDTRLLTAFPVLRSMARDIVITLDKPASPDGLRLRQGN